MRPRTNDFVSDEVLSAADMNAIQDRIRDLDRSNGAWLASPPYVESAGSSVIVGPHRGLALGGIELDPAGSTTVTLPTLTADTWYYLYAFDDGSYGVDYELSTTIPDDIFMDGDDSRRFVCAVRAVATNKVRPFRRTRDGNVTYRWSAETDGSGGLAEGAALSGGTATSYTDVNLAAWLPPNSKIAKLLAGLFNSSTTTDYNADFRTNGDSNIAFRVHVSTQNVSGDNEATCFEIVTDGDQKIEYVVENANLSVNLSVLGYLED
jgi:hypothetical protein